MRTFCVLRLISSRYVSRPPQLRGPVALCLEEYTKWRQAASPLQHVSTPSRYVRAHRTPCRTLRRSLARRCSPARRRRRYMPPTHAVVRMRALTASRQCKRTRRRLSQRACARTAATGEFSPEATSMWWSTHGTLEFAELTTALHITLLYYTYSYYMQFSPWLCANCRPRANLGHDATRRPLVNPAP